MVRKSVQHSSVVLRPEAMGLVREAYSLAIARIALNEREFAHINSITTKLANRVIRQVRNGSNDPQQLSDDALAALRAERSRI
jgi:hypothetical protein